MNPLDINKQNKSEINIIAESSNKLRIEQIINLGNNDKKEIIDLSKELEPIFGINSIITDNNINKYFNENTFPFIARLNNKIIGFIVGVPLENFSNESWSHYDSNLGEKNTIYTYIYLMKEFYRNKIGYSKTLKMVYVNWCTKNNYKYITGHVKSGISQNFSKETKIIKIFSKWYNAKDPFEYYRRPL